MHADILGSVLTPVWFVARTQRRSRRVALIGLGVFVGILSAISIALIAGARRSSSVVDRFSAAATPYDAQVFGSPLPPSEVRALPGVKRADPNSFIATTYVDGSGQPPAGINGRIVDFSAPADPTVRVLRGKLPDGHDPLQVVVNEIFVQQFATSVGERVTVQMFSPDQYDEVQQGIYKPRGPKYELAIAAIVRLPEDVVVDEGRSASARAYRTPNAMLLPLGLWEQHHNEFLDFGQSYLVQLADGQAGMPALPKAAGALAGPGAQPLAVVPANADSRRTSYIAPVALETTALLALGIGLAVAAAATTMLLLRTEQRFHERDTPKLHALGYTPPQLVALAALRTLPAALLGGVVALAGAIELSNRFPIGIGRELELHPGLQVNIAVVAVGTIVTVAFVAGVSTLAARLGRRRTRVTVPRFNVTRGLRWAGAPTEAALGAHLAFDGPRGRRSSATTQGLVGGVVALVVVGAVGMWVGGVDRLYDVPARHGWPWDVAIGNINFKMVPATLSRLATDPRLAKQTQAAFGQVSLNGVSSEVFAFDPSGTAPPEILSGRLPTSPNEIALGSREMHRLGVAVGDTVALSVAGGEFDNVEDDVSDVEQSLTVVGTTLAPMFGESDLGDVSVVPLDTIKAAGGRAYPTLVMARLSGPDPSAVEAQLERDLSEEQLLDIVPARVVNMHRVRRVPLLGIVLASALGTIVLAYVVFAGVRSYRRELAVLRAIGLDAKRVRRVMVWHGALTAIVVVVIGIPFALLAGAALWRRVTDDIGIRPGAVVPPALFLVVPASIAVAVAAGLFADRRARRSHVAEVLRAE
ncbi:MAG: FtsX-like permease family protein [Acidimicrobiales bacterium]